MSDKIYIFNSPLTDFSTSLWGVLWRMGGQAILNKVKAFNRARRMLHCGANAFRILRSGIWGVQVKFDWEDSNYFSLLREYLQILHQPYQGIPTGNGAMIVIELFDNCQEQWFYDKANDAKSRLLIKTFLKKIGDLPYVEFGAGNEINKDDGIAFMERVVFPVFKDSGRIPWSYGATFQPDNDYVGKQKQAAYRVFGTDDIAYSIFKQVHGIKDKDSPALITSASYWVNNSRKLRTMWSVDGVKDGNNKCDFYDDGKRRHVRPSPEQVKSALKYVLDYAHYTDTPAHAIRFAFEYICKVINNDICASQATLAASQAYHDKFGVWPENYGKYPKDWIESPLPPPPSPPPPSPPVPPMPEKPWWIKLWEIIKEWFK